MATLPPQIGRRRTPPCVKKTRNRPAPLKGSSFPTLLLLLHTVVAVDLSSHLAAAAISPSPLVPYLLLVFANCEGDGTRRATGISISPQSPQREGAFYPFQYQTEIRSSYLFVRVVLPDLPLGS
ncbi:hypothetical protein LXL04_007026 [Taraxacum kok-saghyz]